MALVLGTHSTPWRFWKDSGTLKKTLNFFSGPWDPSRPVYSAHSPAAGPVMDLEEVGGGCGCGWDPL